MGRGHKGRDERQHGKRAGAADDSQQRFFKNFPGAVGAAAGVRMRRRGARRWLLQNRAGAVRLSAEPVARCDKEVSPRQGVPFLSSQTWRKELCR